MINKKLFLISLIICIITSMLFFINSSASNSENIFEKQQNALKHNEMIRKMFKDKYRKEYPTYFAGCYIDDEGNLNVNISGDDKQEIKNLVKDDKVKVHKVKYSLEYLENIINTLNPKMGELGITRIRLSEKNNKVYIYLNTLNESSINYINAIANTSAIEVNKNECDIKLTSTTEVINGKEIKFGSDSGGPTIAFGVIDNNGNKGVVTAGHIQNAIGTSAYYNGVKIGTLTRKTVGSADASFIKFDNSSTTWKTTRKFMNGDNFYNWYNTYSYPENTAVRMYGRRSGLTTGNINSNNESYSAAGYYFCDMVSATYSSQNGDSGAAVTTYVSGQYPGNYILGMQSATDGTLSYFAKLGNCLNNLSVTPYVD